MNNPFLPLRFREHKPYKQERNTFSSKKRCCMTVSFNAVKKNTTLGQFLDEKEEGEQE